MKFKPIGKTMISILRNLSVMIFYKGDTKLFIKIQNGVLENILERRSVESNVIHIFSQNEIKYRSSSICPFYVLFYFVYVVRKIFSH